MVTILRSTVQITDKVYPVPAQGIGNECSLRLTPSKNKQEKNVKWAADYEL